MENKGFTIIELIISIFILSVAIVGIYNSFSAMVYMTNNASNNLKAAYLTQEGLEIVRNIRDNNWVSGNDWNIGLDDTNQCAIGCEADYTTGTSPGNSMITHFGDYLFLNTNGFYQYNQAGATQTIFKRDIVITSVSSDILKVAVTVTWDQAANILNPGAKQGSIEADEYLYNWY